jgi:hypothetical protein
MWHEGKLFMTGRPSTVIPEFQVEGTDTVAIRIVGDEKIRYTKQDWLK